MDWIIVVRGHFVARIYGTLAAPWLTHNTKDQHLLKTDLFHEVDHEQL